MRKIFRQTILLSVLLCNLSSEAQTGDKSLIWQISGNGLAKPSYIFGTIHLICPEDYIWTKPMSNAFAHSDKLCMEMNLGDQAIMMQIAVAMIDKSGKKLKDYFTKEQYQKLEDKFKQNTGMDLTPLQQLKPIALESMLIEKSSGCSDPISYEDSLMRMANTAHKELDGLEQPAEQMAALDAMPTDSVIADIMKALDDTSHADNEYTQMVAAYKSQDLPGLYSIITSSNSMDGEMGPLLNDRNAKWIERIENRIKTQSVFFAVGAGHLWGDKGIITLLRLKGYKVEALY